ncbi:MAG: phosphoenolpyruvate--protein phosphotransferase [Alphaproteobacteria bacterium]|nr:phosphoenolpyruvate--protein phosphotransferase [Alphaproteobacteria bacterium]
MKNDIERKIKGNGVAPGIAVGPAFIIEQSGVPVPEYDIPSAQVENELKRLHSAIDKVQQHLAQLRQKARDLPVGAEDMTLLLDAYKGMLSGSRLVRGVEEIIAKQRINAEAAIQKQIGKLKADFAAMDDPYLAARADDVGEVGARLLRSLLQQNYNPFADAPEGCVILAEEITPADAALLDPGRVVGFATVLGGAEGHAAIIARALGLPAISGVGALTHGIKTGDTVVIDGYKGEIVIRPDAETLQRVRQEIQRKKQEDKRLKALRDIPALTVDNKLIALQANMELPRDLDAVRDSGAAGVGLLRTEFMFMNRATLPDEEEQYQALRKMIEALNGLPLTVRTLDIGGEKLASALGGMSEECANPALGLRAIRLGLKEPKILETQLTAILRASMHGPVRILIPMVSSVSQMTEVRAHLLQVERRLHRRGIKPKGLPPLGAMIEIPSAALVADALAKVCDFFSIGSNDLTQYTLAIDRGDDSVANLYDPYHPAVLRLIQFTVAAAWRANIPVALCGEIAGDPRATPLLLGLGLRELSMSPLRLPAVKSEIMQIALPQASDFAEQVMSKINQHEILDLLQKRITAKEKRV